MQKSGWLEIIDYNNRKARFFMVGVKFKTAIFLSAFWLTSFGYCLNSLAAVPENAFEQGGNWYCKSGYRKVGNACEKIDVPANAFVQGSNWYCKSGYRREGNECLKFAVPANAFARGGQWFCNLGYKRVTDTCVEMSPEEKARQTAQIQMSRARERNRVIRIDDREFTLRDVERKCEVYRYSGNYGEVECSGYDLRIVSRKCEAYFYDELGNTGELECRGSELNPVEKYCEVSMYSREYGSIEC